MGDILFGFNEVAFRFVAFVAIFAAVAAGELLAPKRPLSLPKLRRWMTNLSIVVVDSLLVRIMAALPSMLGMAAVPLVAVAAAVVASEAEFGLFNRVGSPPWLSIIVSLVVLDFAIWLQHLASHKIPILWQLHKVHHADRDIDVTTAIRFHPIEIGLSMIYKVLIVLLLGVPPVAVVLFEVILNGCAMFNHGNIALPRTLDALLRLVVVTPDMHRVHHSVLRTEHDANYGFNLSIWDRMFATYVAQPAEGHRGMTIGLAPYQSAGPTRLVFSLMMPFRKPVVAKVD